MPELGNVIWADGPSGAPYQPQKFQIRAWTTWVESAITGIAAGATIYDSKTDMDADTSQDANAMAWVLGDATAANNGVYQFDGTSTWTRLGDLPYSVVYAQNAGAGTANAVQATTSVPVSSTAYSQLISVPFVAANTGAMTISINSETPRDLVLNTGGAIPSGYIKAGMAALVMLANNGDYRLFSYGDASAIQAAAEAAATAAEQSASDAQIAVSSISIKDFATVADAEATSVSEDTNTLIVSGQNFVRAANDDVPASIQSSDGQWWARADIDRVHPDWFKKSSDADDTACLQAAINTGKPVALTRVYNLSDTISYTGDCFDLIGYGREQSRLIFTGAGGIDITLNGPILAPGKGAHLANFTVSSVGAVADDAIAINVLDPSDAMVRSAVVDAVAVLGLDHTADQHLRGLHLTNCRSALVRNFYWRGNALTPNSRGIALDGNCVETHIHAPQLYDGDAGIHITEFPQGVTINDHCIVGFNTGIYWNPDEVQDMLIVANGHLSCGTVAIQALNSVNAKIHNNTISDRAIAGFVAVDMNSNCTLWDVAGNYILSNFQDGSTTTFAFLMHDGNNNHTFRGNMIRNYDIGFQLANDTFGCLADRSNRFFAVGTPFVNQSALSNSIEAGYDTFSRDLPTGITPSVAGYDGYVWFTRNTATTAITNFSDGFEGQVIHIEMEDGFTSIAHGDNIFTAGGVDIANAAGQVFTFKMVSGAWRQIGVG